MALKTVKVVNLTSAVVGSYVVPAGKSFFGTVTLCNLDSNPVTVEIFWTGSDKEVITLNPAGNKGNVFKAEFVSGPQTSSDNIIAAISFTSTANYNFNVQGDEFTT